MMSMSYSDKEDLRSALKVARDMSYADRDKARELTSQVKAQYIAKYASDSDAMRDLEYEVNDKTPFSYRSV